jgi:hypothetical protein
MNAVSFQRVMARAANRRIRHHQGLGELAARKTPALALACRKDYFELSTGIHKACRLRFLS